MKVATYCAKSSIQKLRNVGIIAHINAGKTTTTERILFNSGTTEIVGDVDQGNTVTDYLTQERDRGITITSAAVTYNWLKHQINLIDTPGHVDFTFEVERSLAVLDGCVTLLDSSAGVEAQTVTVWNQAKKYQLPNLIFLNKYDKAQANYKLCIKDLQNSLDINTSLIQLPIKLEDKFTSVVDIIKGNCISWIDPEQDHGKNYIIESIDKSLILDSKNRELIVSLREELVNKLSDLDDEFASHVLECDKISDVSSDEIINVLRRATLNCSISPILVGSSFKYIGVQQLMNAIIDYLPSPIDREAQLKKLLNNINENKTTDETCGFIFKIMHDKRLGSLSYAKLLNGNLRKLQKIKNLETENCEQIKKIHRVFADELREIDGETIHKHDIVVLTGLNEFRTGDIIVDQNSKAPELNDTKMPFKLMNGQILIPQINIIEPVYFCTIESKNISQQMKLESALSNLAREDPSFTYDIDSLGLTTIKGMGKLHLDVIRDRITTEYNIEPVLGPLQISYCETIKDSATEELSVDRLINSVNNRVTIRIYVRSKPKAGVWTGKHLRLDMSGESVLGKLRHDHRKAIENGFISAFSSGPLFGFPMIDCDLLLLHFEANRRCTLPVISSVASQCLSSAMKRCQPVLLEPIMLLEVICPTEHNGIVLTNLTGPRRSIILSTRAKSGGTIVIRSHTPLAALTDYSEFLRISTSGRGSFSMELFSYSAVSESERQNIIKV